VTGNQYKHFDDVSDVTGVMSKDKLLFVGDNSMTFMKKYVDEVITINENDLNSEFVKHMAFDRIFVNTDRFDEGVVSSVLQLSVGTVSFFIENDDERKTLKNYIYNNWYPAATWDFVSNVGKCLVTEARGGLQRRSK